MDLPNLDNFPVYILNVVPELSDENNIQIPQQLTSDEHVPYNFYVPSMEHQVPILSTESVPPVVTRINNKVPTKKLLHEKPVQNTILNHNQNFELVI